MNTSKSVYPTALADKCVEILCTQHQNLAQAAAFLAAARYLMAHGYVVPDSGKRWQGALFAVLSPVTPRYYYAVNLRFETCTCADFLRLQRPCKHIGAVVLTLLARHRLGLTSPAKVANRRAK